MMIINKQSYARNKTTRKFLLVVALALIALGYTVSRYLPQSSTNIMVNLSSIHQNIMFTSDKIYFLNGAAYDFYSIDELNNRLGSGLQWKTFPLPNEQIPANISPWTPGNYRGNRITSVDMPRPSETTTGLAFVDHIYITSAVNLTDRQANLEKLFAQYQITNYDWRMKWVKDTCYVPEKKEEVYRKINLRVKSINGGKQKRQCAVTMEHIDIWHDIVARNSSLSLILEDDAVFVSNFREKFDRTIYTAIRTGALKIGRLSHCVSGKSRLSANSNEWFEQDPVIVIGGCMQMNDDAFAKNRRDAPPMLSTQKQSASRCTHAYLLTACSAQALLRQIAARKNTFLQSDLLLNALVVSSPTLQSFWLDPPLVYQGNRITDLDRIPSFKRTTY